MPVATDGTMLPDDDWEQLQAFADAFAAARLTGPIDDWEKYLPPAGTKLRRPVLVELIKVDLELSWREGQRILVDSYAARFAELPPMPVGLIVEEHNIRKRSGDKPDLEEYRRRFPDQFAEFERKVQSQPTDASVVQTKRGDPVLIDKGGLLTPAPPRAPEGYTLLERIGKGNFGEVWKAEAPGGIEVALKIVSQPLDHDAAQRELQSLELIKKLQHPALLATLAFWVVDNHLVIAMELADGSLRDRLRECQQQGKPGIPAHELLTYFRDAAAGLDWLHWQKVLHRDVKPENILLKKGYARVADFGLAQSRAHSQSVMVSSSFAGTPAFMPPELWAGKVCEQSDQYSLAFTYAELRLGRRPLEGADFYTVMKSILEQEPNLGDLPQPEATVLRRALSKKPEERFGTCQDFVESLERAITPDAMSRRRTVPAAASPATSGSQVTERTERGLEPPLKATDFETTVRTEPSAAMGGKPTVWKPPGPSSAAKKSSLPIVVGVAAVILGLGFLTYLGIQLLSKTGNGTTLASTSDKEPTKQIITPTPSKKEDPKEKADFLPPNYVAADPKEKLVEVSNKKYHRRLLFRKAGQEAEFVLIAPDDGSRPYYAMVNKAWNGLMTAFATEKAGAVTKDIWKDAPRWLPAVNMTVEEAHRCADWMGGKLPTKEQWDFAAGLKQRLNADGAAVARPEPRAVNVDHGDHSPAGVHDMLGNGREFTRNLLGGGAVPKPGVAPEGEHVILRGRMWTLTRGLTIEDLNYERDNPQRQFYGKASPYTGFRVVLEVE